LHKLTPDGFEEFVIYVLKSYGMEFTRVGGTGDEGIDGIGLAPISPVLYSRVAVQAKRYDPASTLRRFDVRRSRSFSAMRRLRSRTRRARDTGPVLRGR
jgi:restriction endonuclease Mrr